MWGNVTSYHSVCADFCMIADGDRPNDFCTGTDVDMGADFYPLNNCDLLKDQAIGANLRFRVDDNACRMRQQEAPTDIAVQGDVGGCDRAPKPVSQ